jgi:thioester reductase-like protein
VRPSILVGDSKTGEIDVFDGPYLFVLLLLGSPVDLTLPLPSRGDLTLNLVPVDYVARAAVALGREPAATSRTFHLVDPAPLPSRRVFELVAQSAGKKLPRGFIPVNLTRALLRTPGLERFAKSPRAFLERLATECRYMSQSARELLGPLGIECPPFERYVDPLVGHVRQRMAERRGVRHHPSETDEIDDPLA